MTDTKQWRRRTIAGLGVVLERVRPDGSLVSIWPAWEGSHRVTIRQPEVFSAASPGREATYVYTIAHSRRFPA